MLTALERLERLDGSAPAPSQPPDHSAPARVAQVRLPVRAPQLRPPVYQQPASTQAGPQAQGPATQVAPLQHHQRASYRRSIRSRGPLVALVVPALAGLVGLMLLRGNDSTTRGVGGFVLVMLAAPLLTVAGVPLRSGASVYLAAVVASAVLWLLLGLIASRRATRTTVATWGRFWGEYLVMLCAVWAGTVLAIVAANVVLGRAVI